MHKDTRPFEPARRSYRALCAACLSAFLVFGNAVSAFGNAAAPDDSRAKAADARASDKTSDKASAKPAASPADASTGEAKGTPSPRPAAKTNARKPLFRKIGEPFLVSTAADTRQS